MIQYVTPVLLLAFATASTIENTNEEKDVAFEDAARSYRIQTYDTYRLQRAEFDRRAELGREASRRYYAASKTEQQEIIQWLADSTVAPSGALPALPGGEFRSTEQIAEDAADATTESLVGSSSTQIDSTGLSHSSGYSSADHDSADDGLASDSAIDDAKSYNTSIIRNDKYGAAGRSRTFSILNSVGRAVTTAVANGGESDSSMVAVERNDDQAIAQQFEPVPADKREMVVPAELDEDAFELSDEDFDLEEMILESPADDVPLQPTPETFEREARLKIRSNLRFANRLERLEKARYRVSLRLDMKGMTVEQIAGAVDLAEEMCWHYRTLSSYLMAIDGDASVVDAPAVRAQVNRLKNRLDRGIAVYRQAVQKNPSISSHIVRLEELLLRAESLQGEVSTAA